MDFEKSRIERLKRSLYSRDQSRVPVEKRTPVHGAEFSTQRDWGERPSFTLPPEALKKQKNSSFFHNFLGISLIFFCLCLGAVIFIFFGGLNMISSNNVDISIAGPSTISSGEETDAQITIVNQNRAALENAILYIDYPDGTQSVASHSVPLIHDQVNLGEILKGAQAGYSLRALFFGATGLVKTVNVRLEYSIKGSDATFTKEKTYDISIGSSPVILNVGYPAEIDSGQPVTLAIKLTSNSSVVLPHTIVKVEYPYGFTYKSSDIKPLSGATSAGAVWDVGDIKNGDTKTFSITGVLVGQDSEERSFRISTGTKSNSSNDIAIELASSDATVAIRKSLFGLNVSADGSSGNVGTFSQQTPMTITWQNTLSDKVVNGQVQAVLSGNALDRSSVSPSSGGFYQSSNNSITWDKNTTDSLADISPGDIGRMTFSVGALSDTASIHSIKNPHIDITVTMSGDRTSSDSGTISSVAQTTIKFNSLFAVLSRLYRNTGAFVNTGPLPPKADKQTTYTVTWTMTNTNNDLTGATMSATLPSGVSWVGKTSPSGESISYNPDNRQVVWNAGNVSAGAGFTYSPREVSFQISLQPSVTDVGSIVQVLSPAHATAVDSYTSATLSSNGSGLNTHYSDVGFRIGDDIVTN